MNEKNYLELTKYMNWAYGNKWSVTYTPWGEKIICHLTIENVTRSGASIDDRRAFREAAFLFEDLRTQLEDIEDK